MAERRSEKDAPLPWRVPVAVEDVAETGERFELVADGEVRAALARIARLRELPRLQAYFEVARHGAAGLRVAGRISATVGQVCVVTLEPLANEVAEEIDLLFVPPAPTKPEGPASPAPPDRDPDDVEPLIGGSIDLGALAAEFLLLGIEPYPRKPGAVFAPPPDALPDEGPFAALAAKKGRDGR